MRDAGFAVDSETQDVADPAGTTQYVRHRFDLTRGTDQAILLECLVYPDGTETYWLQLRRMLAMRSFPFQLDSWKYHQDRVEFRYYARPDGVALTFELLLN